MKNPVHKKDKKNKDAVLVRGGRWDIIARGARVSFRFVRDPSYRYGFYGLRIVRNKNEKSD